MCTAAFREVGELKSTRKDKFVLCTSSVLLLCKPVLSLLVTLAAGFYSPFSAKKLSVNPQSLEALPRSHERLSSLCSDGADPDCIRM